MSDEPRISIIGGGQAAARTYGVLREHNPNLNISLFSDEKILPYERPPLSKECLDVEHSPAPSYVNPVSDYESIHSSIFLNTVVSTIDRSNNLLCLEGGETHYYDYLLIATGAKPRLLPDMEKTDNTVMTFRTIKDAERLTMKLTSIERIVVIGGGAIGTEIAAAAFKRGIKVTVIEGAGRLLSRCVSPQIANLFMKMHFSHGVELLFNRTVTMARNGTVELSDGTEISADLIVVAIGVMPNTALAEKAGLKVSNGIKVNECCRTSDEYIFAAGDVSNYFDPFLRRRVRPESWTTANIQAEAVARTILGIPIEAPRPPLFWTTQYGYEFQMCGDVLTDDVDIQISEENTRVIARHFDGPNLVGITCANQPRAFRKLSRELINRENI
ncbi:NAD(P)/FAD-dependent oxidoreductase [Candidatus Nitrotoga sp. M5]|uniref:NAD(P)/FAD-dependent oxidoreductase n=1 Tax=Candidatus Nitrotoga sp. M5 TaxID=2890409 RepID=UPI001EF5FED9|nr:FAD-dependent oxidoreductase [Candidatus Nitrotoga sp. M5]CAH1387947.1 putative 3-phenylpropionate/cinnamic acid dioxygenase ferredoxin--NAD(+) reductase component [Candidatus Nitrotoga sp. M5]